MRVRLSQKGAAEGGGECIYRYSSTGVVLLVQSSNAPREGSYRNEEYGLQLGSKRNTCLAHDELKIR